MVTPARLMILAAAMLVAGFVYDGIFAGLPYLDPEPELQQRWLFHKAIANKIIGAAIAIAVLSLVWTMLRFAKRWIF
ncbi:MAG: hypothetical protein WA921_14240 [Ahrensia sp.]